MEADNANLTAKLHKNGYNQIWHYCTSGKIRPYPSVYCSTCLPINENKNFNAFNEINQLQAENQDLHREYQDIANQFNNALDENQRLLGIISGMDKEIQALQD